MSDPGGRHGARENDPRHWCRRTVRAARRHQTSLGSLSAPIDESQRQKVTAEAEVLHARRNKVAAAGGELLGAALSLVGELIDHGSKPSDETVTQIRVGLEDCVERDNEGKMQLRLTLQNDEALNGLATTLAKLLVGK